MTVMNRTMKRMVFFAILVAAVSFFGSIRRGTGPGSGAAPSGTAPPAGSSTLARAVGNQQSNVQVEGNAVVAKVLPDDNDGSRHQRFLIRLPTRQTVLIAHNIDLAPRIDSLQAGDRVGFCGEYEWNERGGVLHWTHHDPARRHPPGWIKHHGRVYQ